MKGRGDEYRRIGRVMKGVKKIKIKDLINFALGKKEADLLITDGLLVNVFTGEIYRENIAVSGGYIVGFGDYPAKETISARGMYLVPGLIDGHLHIESTMMSVREFARAVSPLGTTSCVIDPHEIANVLGIDGIKYILESSKFQPINIFVMLPSCVPATPLETSGANLTAYDLYPFAAEKWVLGLGEVMNFPAVLSADPDMMNKLKIFSNKRIDGHCPGLTGKALSAYIAGGIRSDHETTTVKEAREKLQKGMYLMIREATGAKNLDALLPAVTQENKRRIIFVTDDRHPHELISEGHIDHMVRRAIRYGLPPIDAVRCATLNTAEYYRMDFVGAIAPGYMADILFVEDLKKFKINTVIKKGVTVAIDGRFVGRDVKAKKIPLRSSVNVKWLHQNDFIIRKKTGRARVICVVPGQITTTAKVMPVSGGSVFIPDFKRDLLKICVVERHQASGRIGKGIVKGFGMKRGAIASSVAHDSHNIICVGCDDLSILTAVVEIVKMGGGLSVALNDKVLAHQALPIAGLMADLPLEILDRALKSMIGIYKENLEGVLDDPFMALSFLSLPVIPELKLTDFGLVDVNKFKTVNLFV